MKPIKLQNFINLNRVKILDENDDFYSVEYNSQLYTIAKDSESRFVQSSPVNPSMSMHLEQKLEQVLMPETGIFQDKKVPQSFKEVMMFHEIREMEYRDAGFNDAHQRAVNDEVLYIQKFLSKKAQKFYLWFAAHYRAIALSQKTLNFMMAEAIKLYPGKKESE